MLLSILAWLRANWSRLTLYVGCFLVGLFLATRCSSPTPVAAPKQQIVYRPSYVAVHDTIAKVKLVDRVVVKAVFVPRIGPVIAGKTNYLLKTDTLVVAANCDSTGLRIDSLAFKNRQSIIVGVDKKGNGMVQIINSSPFVHTDSASGYRFRVKQLSRVTYGLSAGIGMTPVGLQPYVGFGVHLSLNKRK